MIVFATIFGVGFLMLIISLIFGGDGEFDVDADADIDGDFGGDVGGDFAGGPSIFSVKMVALLMVGFGAVGFGFKATTDWTNFQASMAGIGGALVIAVVGWLILRLFYASQASSTIGDRDIVGVEANVIDAVNGNDYGQVACVIRGREITFLARSHDSNSIARNTPVRIVGKSGNVVTIQPLP